VSLKSNIAGSIRMKILLTGACGFIGSRLTRILLERGDTDLMLVDAHSHRDRSCFHGLEGIPFTDRADLLDRLPSLDGFDAVAHLGACTDTGVSDEAYVEKWNTGYTRALWAWCARRGLRFVYASSAATYGRGENGYSDDHALQEKLQPLNLYGKSKHRFDLWALSQNTPPPLWAGLKFFNVYGPGEDHKGRMASPIWHGYREIKRTGQQTLFKSHRADVSDGMQSRDFIFVDDIVDKVLFHLEGKAPSGLYNCGTGHAKTFMALSNALFSALGTAQKVQWVDTPEKYRAGYQYFTQADMAKSRAAGYGKSALSLEEGVARYVEYLNRSWR
jgi:ADP-L-glycero-D-manno-heptose 6-epimerase